MLLRRHGGGCWERLCAFIQLFIQLVQILSEAKTIKHERWQSDRGREKVGVGGDEPGGVQLGREERRCTDN